MPILNLLLALSFAGADLLASASAAGGIHAIAITIASVAMGAQRGGPF